MRRFLISLAVGLLTCTLAALGIAIWLYVSLSPASSEIARRAEKEVPVPPSIPAPQGKTEEVKTIKQVCFMTPEIHGFLKISMRNVCNDVPIESRTQHTDPSDDEMRAWKTALEQQSAKRTSEVQKVAQRIANEERERMRKEIEFWAVLIAGPAPFIVGLSGFIAALVLDNRRKLPPAD